MQQAPAAESQQRGSFRRSVTGFGLERSGSKRSGSKAEGLQQQDYRDRGNPQSFLREAIVIVMVGLPARGKSYISNLLVRFLRLHGSHVRIFNAGNLRREHGAAGATAEFFSATNAEAKAQRETLAMQCCGEMLKWIYSTHDDRSLIAILDATNTTRERRKCVVQRCRAAAAEALLEPEGDPPPLRIIFIESICASPEILQNNYKMKLKNADYIDATDLEEAQADFKRRVAQYEAQYEPLEDAEIEEAGTEVDGEEAMVPSGLFRITDGGEKIQCCHLGGSLVMMGISTLLTSFHLKPRKIFLVPESAVDVETLATLIRSAECTDGGRPVDLMCRASTRVAHLAQEADKLLSCFGKHRAVPSEEGQRHPRGILALRNLEPKFGASSNSQNDHGLKAETFEDLVQRATNVLYMIERLQRSIVVLYPEADVGRVLLAHFYGCPEGVDPSTMSLPPGPVIELLRDHKGFSLREFPVPVADLTSSSITT